MKATTVTKNFNKSVNNGCNLTNLYSLLLVVNFSMYEFIQT